MGHEPQTAREAAALYLHRGWSVIPVKAGTKEPATGRWKQYQERLLTAAEFERMFADPARGVAIILGPVSGGLACRDFDDAAAYRAWAARHPDLAHDLPTVATRRGAHVYFLTKLTGRNVEHLGDGELRVARCFNLAPPTLHPSGGAYRWVRPPRAALPLIDDLFEAGLARSYREHRADRANGGLQSTQTRTEAMGKGGSFSTSVADGFPHDVQDAIVLTLPAAEGERNRRLFDLARRLRALPHLNDAPAASAVPYLREWHRLAVPVIGTKPFEDSLAEFLRAWKRVRFPHGQEPLAMILQAARSAEFPEAADLFEGDAARLLVAVCRELQRAAGDGPFYLSCRKAGELIGLHYTRAADYLAMLADLGIVQVVEVGSAETNRATRYRYLAD